MKSKYRNIFLAFGIVVVIIMLLTMNMSYEELWQNLLRAGYYLPLIILLWLVVYVINTCSWYVILHSSGPVNIPFWRLYKYSVSGFALNYVTPVGLMGGEPYRIMELTPYVGVEQTEIVFSRRVFLVRRFEPVALDHRPRRHISVEALGEVHLGDAVHGGLAGHKVDEVVSLHLHPHLVCASQVELDDDAVKEVVMTRADLSLAKRVNAFGNFAVKGGSVHRHGELCPPNRLIKAEDVDILYLHTRYLRASLLTSSSYSLGGRFIGILAFASA